MCSWVLRAARGGGREGRGHDWGGSCEGLKNKPEVPYVLPLLRGGSQVGGIAQRGPSVEKGGQPPGLRAPGKGGVGGRISSEPRVGGKEGLRGGRAWSKREQAGVALPSQLSWAQPLPCLSSAPAPGEQR